MLHGRSERHLVAGTTGWRALEAGRDVLAAGGNAMDAALATALGQTVACAGCWSSLGGILALIYFDAATGQTHTLDAGFRSFAGERDPLRIGGDGPLGVRAKPAPTGRSALVPGFIAGVQAAHARFGSMPLARLFEPALQAAERGIVIDGVLAARFRRAAPVLKRLPATRAVYAPAGSVPRLGDVLTQPALGETLRGVMRDGADHMYRGAWAELFVQAVRSEGGHVSLEDLAGYRAEWSAPRRLEYEEQLVCSVGGRNAGGLALLETLRILEAAGVRDPASFVRCSETLYWVTRALQVGHVMQFTPYLLPHDPEFVTTRLGGTSIEPDARLGPGQAAAFVGHIRAGRWDQVMLGLAAANLSTHTDAIAIIDVQGNACALAHSLGSEIWGSTGLNVGGVSIPDVAATQGGAVAAAGPGGYLASQLNPTLVLERGRPRLAAAAIGKVLYAMVGHLAPLLSSRRSAIEAAALPIITGQPFQELVPPGRVSPAVLERAKAAGLRWLDEGIDRVPSHWVCVAVEDSSVGRLCGAATRGLEEIGGGVLGG